MKFKNLVLISPAAGGLSQKETMKELLKVLRSYLCWTSFMRSIALGERNALTFSYRSRNHLNIQLLLSKHVIHPYFYVKQL